MPARASAISAPWFCEPSESKDKLGGVKNWLQRTLKWGCNYIASFDGAYTAAKTIRYTSDWASRAAAPHAASGGSGAALLRRATILRTFGANAEHLLNAFNIPVRLRDAALSIRGVFSAFRVDAAKRSPHDKTKAQALFKAALDVNDIADPICDGTALLKDLKLVRTIRNKVICVKSQLI